MIKYRQPNKMKITKNKHKASLVINKLSVSAKGRRTPSSLKENKRRDVQLFNTQAIHLLKWVLSQTKCSGKLLKPILRYTDYLNRISTNSGIKFAVAYNKIIRTSFTRFLGCYRNQNIDYNKVQGVRSTKNGLPYCMLRLWKEIAELSPRDSKPELFRANIQVVMTMLNCPRALRLSENPEIETITSPSSKDFDIGVFKPYMKDFIFELEKNNNSKGILQHGKFKNRPI